MEETLTGFDQPVGEIVFEETIIMEILGTKLRAVDCGSDHGIEMSLVNYDFISIDARFMRVEISYLSSGYNEYRVNVSYDICIVEVFAYRYVSITRSMT
jgi:hypothetical protein